MEPELSIIIPVYNSEEYLRTCIDSVIAQTYTNYELILVDDCSTDKSGKICEEYKIQDNRVRVIHHDKNKGLSISREDGFHASRGRWISFVDNDDLIAHDMYEQLMSHKQENIDVACVRGEDRSCKEMITPDWGNQEMVSFTLSGRAACEKIYSKEIDFGCVGPMWAKIYKREILAEALQDVQIYKERLNWVYFEDVLFMPFLWNRVKNVAFDNVLMYMHRRVSTNLSSSLQPKPFHFQACEAGFIVTDFLESKGMQQAAQEHLLGSLMGMQSTWYKVNKFMKNTSMLYDYEIYVDAQLKKYVGMLLKIHYMQRNKKMFRLSILLFDYSKKLWNMVIGIPYFELLRR